MATTRLNITRSGLIAAAMVMAVLIAVAITAVLGLRYADARMTETARAESLDAAKSYASTMFGFDPASVDANVAHSKDVVTGPAKAQYDEIIAKNNFVASVRDQQVVSKASIQDAGVVTNTRDTSTVLIFLNQSVSRGGKELIRVDPSRLTFSMTKQDGRWLINGIDIITDDSFRSRIEHTDRPPAGGVPLPAPSSGISAPPGSATSTSNSTGPQPG